MGGAKDEEGLTQKERSAAMHYVEYGCKSKAFKAFYSTNFNDRVVNQKAYELFLRPNVIAFVEKLRAEQRERHNVSVDSLTVDLESDRQLAYKGEQASAAVSATMGKAKLHGLLVEKQERTTTLLITTDQIDKDIDEMFDKE